MDAKSPKEVLRLYETMAKNGFSWAKVSMEVVLVVLRLIMFLCVILVVFLATIQARAHMFMRRYMLCTVGQ